MAKQTRVGRNKLLPKFAFMGENLMYLDLTDQGPVGGAHGAGSPAQQYDFFAEQTLKISLYFMQRIKSYSIFTARQTNRQTHILHPYMHGWDFFNMEFYTIHYTMFLHLLCSLTHFVCEGLNCQLHWNDKNKDKEVGIGPFFKLIGIKNHIIDHRASATKLYCAGLFLTVSVSMLCWEEVTQCRIRIRDRRTRRRRRRRRGPSPASRLRQKCPVLWSRNAKPLSTEVINRCLALCT